MDKKIIITIPHYNNPVGLINTISSINDPIKIDIVITDDGSEIKLDEHQVRSKYNNKGNIHFIYSCLLYTSPSPRDRTRSRMPSSA